MVPETDLTAEVADSLQQEATAAQSTLQKLFGELSLSKLLAAVLILIVCVIIIRVFLKASEKMLNRSRIDRSLHTFIRSAVKIVLIFITVLLLAGTLGIDTSSLLAIFGLAGLAVSLSVQDSLSNFVSAVMLLTTKPFQVGDYVNVSGQEGIVQQIGLLSTVIYTLDNRRIHIPNSQIAADKIVNFTGVEKRRVDLTFTAGYSCDTELVKAALVEAASHKDLLTDEPVFVRVSNYLDSAIEYTVRVWTTPAKYWDVYFDVIENVKRVFDEKNIEMTYPHINVHTVN